LKSILANCLLPIRRRWHSQQRDQRDEHKQSNKQQPATGTPADFAESRQAQAVNTVHNLLFLLTMYKLMIDGKPLDGRPWTADRGR
jgi:hypothetical protein